MRATTVLALWLLAGCQATPPSGAIFRPVAPAKPAAAAPAPASAAAPSGKAAASKPSGFDFDADARKANGASGAKGEEQLDATKVASALGLAKAPPSPGAPAPSPPLASAPLSPAASAPPPAAPAPAPAPAWAPGTPVEGSWGVRLVSTVPEAQPPRAILGMADGSEVVVQPGTLLPDVHLAVLAVGRDAVQLAEFIPSGDHVRVETHVLQAMYGTNHPQH